MASVGLRPMTPRDLDDVLALQANGYPRRFTAPQTPF